MLRRFSSHLTGNETCFNRFIFYLCRHDWTFILKFILPSITYGILVWGSVGKTILDNLERIHIRAARIIYHYAWDKSSEEVQHQTNWKPLKLFCNLKLLKSAFKYHQDLLPTELQDLL